MNPYIADILDQPAALQRTLENFTTSPELTALCDRLQEGKFRRILLTGMGSSYHGLVPLYLRLLNANLPALLMDTSELIYHASAVLQEDSLLVAVSQSGRSAEIVRLLEEVGETLPIIGVTNTPDSPLAKQASVLILTQAGEEYSVSCKTYLATLAGLTYLGDGLLGGQEDPQFPDLQTAPLAVATYLESWEDHILQMGHMLADVGQIFLAGRGASLAAAGTGALILKEAAHIPAEGLSSAAFRHGPFEMTSPHTAVVIFNGSKPTTGLNRKLLRDIQLADGWAALVETSAVYGPFSLPQVPDSALPILEILPVEMMTLALADLRGLEAGKFFLGAKVTSIE
jgi:glutamine---fructose-6-phosphate transaminase (isomerizing)